MLAKSALSLNAAMGLAGKNVAPLLIGGSMTILALAKMVGDAGFGLELPLLDLPGLRKKGEFDTFLRELAVMSSRVDVVLADHTVHSQLFRKTNVRFKLDDWHVLLECPLIMGENFSPLWLAKSVMSAEEWCERLTQADLQLLGVAIDTAEFSAFSEIERERIFTVIAQCQVPLKLVRVTLEASQYHELLISQTKSPLYQLFKRVLKETRFRDKLTIVYDVPPELVNHDELRMLRETVNRLIEYGV